MILDSDLVVTRKKISEIYERRTFNRRERNEYGEWEWNEKDLLFKRPVNVVGFGVRLVHFLIDYFAVAFLFGILDSMLEDQSDSVLISLVPWVGYLGHFIVGEFFFQKTIGKVLTRSLVVNEYGEAPGFKAVLLRTLIRMLPLEPFSCLGSERGWHDRWTNTYVIGKGELMQLRRLLREKSQLQDVLL
jgi:uncharacterized RDD family membrane protein YckC